jgi:hypothetical protein
LSATETQSPPALPNDICPHCGTLAGYKPAIKLKQSFSLIAFLTGGIWGVILLNSARAKRVKCNACERIFTVRPPSSKILLLLLLWLLLAPGFIVIAFYLIHELWSLLRGT